MHSPYILERPGTTKAVMMIHGICSTPRHFDWLLQAFDDSWSIYNILLDGHGGSVEDFANSSMKRWKEQTRQMLDEICGRYETVLLVGHSMGTLLHIYNMPEHPQVKGALLLNVPMMPWVKARMLPMSVRLSRGRARRSNPHEAAMEKDVGIHLTNKLWKYAGWAPRFVELLQLCSYCCFHARNIQVPCFAYFGKRDELVAVESARFFRRNPLVTTRIFTTGGHFWFSPEDRKDILQDLQNLLQTL